MQCDMCDSGAVVLALIEGAEMNVCNSCAKYGTVIGKAEPPKPAVEESKPTIAAAPARRELISMISKDYSQKVKQARERKGLKQEEVAKKLAERTSVIHQVETGHLKPSLALARKLEKFLGITIVETYEETGKTKTTDSGALTIGDMLNNR